MALRVAAEEVFEPTKPWPKKEWFHAASKEAKRGEAMWDEGRRAGWEPKSDNMRSANENVELLKGINDATPEDSIKAAAIKELEIKKESWGCDYNNGITCYMIRAGYWGLSLCCLNAARPMFHVVHVGFSKPSKPKLHSFSDYISICQIKHHQQKSLIWDQIVRDLIISIINWRSYAFRQCSNQK